MRNRYLMLIIFSILIINTGCVLANAPSQIEYYIVQESVLVKMQFDSVQNFELPVPNDISTIDANAEYTIIDLGKTKEIAIQYAQNLEISYITQSLLDKSREEYFFIMDNPFSEKMNVTLYLPETAILTEKKIIFPNTDGITSDGRSITLNWKNTDAEQILVAYTYANSNNALSYIITIVIIAIIGMLYTREKKKHHKEIKHIKEKTKTKKTKAVKEEKLTKNLFEDEKEIVKYLLSKKNNECWTKEMVKDLDISKVKLSRKLRSLEQKEVIKRIPYGNENRIRLLK